MSVTQPVAWEDVPPLIQAAFKGWLEGWEREEMYLVATPRIQQGTIYHGTLFDLEVNGRSAAFGLDCFMDQGEVALSNCPVQLDETHTIFRTNLINIQQNPRQLPYINGG